MPKVALTVGDICKIKDILAEKQKQEQDAASKEMIAELIKKLDEIEIRSQDQSNLTVSLQAFEIDLPPINLIFPKASGPRHGLDAYFCAAMLPPARCPPTCPLRVIVIAPSSKFMPLRMAFFP